MRDRSPQEAGYVGLERRIERSVIAHPNLDCSSGAKRQIQAVVFSIGSLVCGSDRFRDRPWVQPDADDLTFQHAALADR
jgi:hypothetical protein